MRARQTPTYEANIPADLSGDGEMAARLAAAYFGEPMPWQPHLLDVMLARDERDKFRVKTVGISIPRQNGKSWGVRARCFYGALSGECILYTCQQAHTSQTGWEPAVAASLWVAKETSASESATPDEMDETEVT